jgi:hypothetical protein
LPVCGSAELDADQLFDLVGQVTDKRRTRGSADDSGCPGTRTFVVRGGVSGRTGVVQRRMADLVQPRISDTARNAATGRYPPQKAGYETDPFTVTPASASARTPPSRPRLHSSGNPAIAIGGPTLREPIEGYESI